MTLARTVRAQGRRGEILADLFTDFPEQFTDGAELSLLRGDGTRNTVAVESYWMPTGRNAGRVVLKLAGCESITEAESLTGCDLQIAAADRVALASDTYYVSDLVGCVLSDGDSVIGTVIDLHFPHDSEGHRLSEAAPLFVVARADADELLIPFVNAFVERIDIARKTIQMHLPHGLMEVNG